MAKRDNTLIFIGIGILILAIIAFPQLQKKDVVPGISATYYDANGNLLDFQPYNYEQATKGPDMNIFQSFGIVPMSSSYSSVANTYNVYERDASSGYQIDINQLGIGSDGGSAHDSGRDLLLRYNSAPFINNNTLISVTSATLTFPSYSARSGSCDWTADFITNYELTNWNDATSGYNRLEGVSGFGGMWYGYSELPKTFSLDTSVTTNELREGDGLDFGVRGEFGTTDYLTFSTQPQINIQYTYNCNQEATCSALKKTCGSWNICGQTFSCGTCGSGYSCNATGQCFQSAVYARYQINVANNGQVPYKNVNLTSMTPNFMSYFPTTNFNLSNGQSTNWTSSLIDITAYPANLYTVFTAYISGMNTYTNQTQSFSGARLIP